MNRKLKKLGRVVSLFCSFSVLLGGLARFESPAYAMSAKKGPSLWVEVSDGTLACEESPAETLEKSEARLTKAGIKVLDRSKGHDGKMRIQVCGIETGNKNRFLILEKDLETAKKAGFEASQPTKP